TRDATFLLVGEGKFGVADFMRGHDGEHLQVSGSLIERGRDRMLQVDLHTVRFAGPVPTRVSSPVDLGNVTLTGEIVDTKCHLGVKDPGGGKGSWGMGGGFYWGGSPSGFLGWGGGGQTPPLAIGRLRRPSLGAGTAELCRRACSDPGPSRSSRHGTRSES